MIVSKDRRIPAKSTTYEETQQWLDRTLAAARFS